MHNRVKDPNFTYFTYRPKLVRVDQEKARWGCDGGCDEEIESAWNPQKRNEKINKTAINAIFIQIGEAILGILFTVLSGHCISKWMLEKGFPSVNVLNT